VQCITDMTQCFKRQVWWLN